MIGTQQFNMEVAEFKHIDELELNLIQEITNCLQEDIKNHGRATLLLSGGGTPKNLYKKLSEAKIDWNKVIVGLVDERYVPVSNEHSNELMIKDCLLQNEAKQAQFIGMVYYSNESAYNLEIVKAKYEYYFKTISYCLLGMGSDGHTASLFPEDKNSIESLKELSTEPVLTTKAPSYPNKRISCSYNFLKKSKKASIFITGEKKLHVLQNASMNDLPIAYFLDLAKVFYTK